MLYRHDNLGRFLASQSWINNLHWATFWDRQWYWESLRLGQ